MGVATDILRAYVAPRAVFVARLGSAPREDRALAVLMAACLLIFVAQWPRLQREAFETGQEFQVLAGGALLAWLFIVPLAAYAIGSLSHLAARVLGGRGNPYGARFALFWALLVASPLWLLWGLVAGFIGPGMQLTLTGAVALAAFVVHWSLNLWFVERS
ncbi:YIP1 family protein [Maritimibacter sp. HL-12]|uniref:YIP1 family protein n=1 Tax=Maritimibacter sp. HL-12 TaxID=1162418 RepID=UPI000A0EFBD9|nr:YIP1 family protein [Maritimibacter sp. HL-12]SMH56782.1 hypothetical protein SAMN05661107_3303 [Maritimibacter sp. HL-12]